MLYFASQPCIATTLSSSSSSLFLLQPTLAVQEEEATLAEDLTALLGRDEAARLTAAGHRPLAGLLDLSILVRQASARHGWRRRPP